MAVEEKEWHPLEREIDGRKLATGQEWAEVCFVPTWAARSKKGPSYRFLAIRELLGQKEFPGMEVQLPFPTLNWGEKQYKLFGVVTNRDLAGDKLIWWSRERCGKGEEMHAIMKNELAGRVVNRSLQLIIRLSGSHPAHPILLEVRRRLRALWMATESTALALEPP